MRFSRVLLPSVLAFIPIIASAAPETHERTTVEVVQVPVYVTTNGASVRGLTRSDFELRVNGRPRDVDYFDLVDFASLSPDQTRDPRQRRLYVLLFDLVNSSPFSSLRAKRAAEHYIESAQPSDYFAVALLSRYNDIDFIVPLTRDKAALRRAVASFRPASSADPLRLTVSQAERAALVDDNSRELTELRHSGSGVAAELAADRMRIRTVDQLGALGDLAERMAAMQGYKHVVLLSGGFDNSLLLEGRPATTNIFQVGPAPQLASLARQQTPMFDTHLPFSQRLMQKKFAAAGVFLDAIDVAGLRPYNEPPNESLHFVVADTGGQVVEHRNDLTAAMQRLTDSQQVVYVLGFRAQDTGRKQNTISVHVNGAPRGSRVAYRESYSSTPDKPSSNDGLHLADIIINDIPQNGITMTASVTTAPNRATVNVALPGRELAALAGDDARIKGEALIYVFTGQKAVAFARQEINAHTTDTANVEMAQSFDLPPGTYAMKVLVRLDSDTMAFARKDFTIGD